MRICKGFTLAEVMIVLTVIGVLAGILIPVANNSRPDEKVMKFKKANATLANVIHELVTSDKYYANGDLGITSEGQVLSWVGCANDNECEKVQKYFCHSVADILSVKENTCFKGNNNIVGAIDTRVGSEATFANTVPYTGFEPIEVTSENLEKSKQLLDTLCKLASVAMKNEIVASDNIVYYETNPASTFGTNSVLIGGKRYRMSEVMVDNQGFSTFYKVFCIDIDGIPPNATTDDCVNECSFGYGIRADGKILTGARAGEWLEKDFQKGKNEN